MTQHQQSHTRLRSFLVHAVRPAFTTSGAVLGSALGLIIVTSLVRAPDYEFGVVELLVGVFCMMLGACTGLVVGHHIRRKLLHLPLTPEHSIAAELGGAITELTERFWAVVPGVLFVMVLGTLVSIAGPYVVSSYTEHREANQIWEQWQASVCQTSRIERAMFGSKTCKFCQMTSGLHDQAREDPRIQSRLRDLGGEEALLRGLEVCE